MTEAELQILRLNVRLEVHLVLLRMLYTGLVNSSPSASQALREKFAALREEHGKIAIPNLPAEYSDLFAAEYQEALEDVLLTIEAGLKA